MVKKILGKIVLALSLIHICFLAGPRLSTYYATKNYVLKLTMAIYEELRHEKSPVVISALCPGPVNTEFNKVAHGKFKVDGASSCLLYTS